MAQKQNNIYRTWVSHLVEQNSDLIKTVADIEHEACEKLTQLERNKGLCSYNTSQLRSDLDSMVELVRRAQTDQRWDFEGLHFNYINPETILGLADRET